MDLIESATIKPREGLLPELRGPKTDEQSSIAWVQAQVKKYGKCELDLPFKAAGQAADQPTTGGRATAKMPAPVLDHLRASNDPTGICLTALHVLVQRYTTAADGLYGVFGVGGGAPAIAFVDATGPATPLSEVMGTCNDAWRGAKARAEDCAALASQMNGSMPRPPVVLSLCDRNLNAGDRGVLLAVDVMLNDGTIAVSWSEDTLDTTYVKTLPEHLLALLQALCNDTQGPALLVDYLSDSECKLLTIECNDTTAVLPPGCTHNFMTAAAQKDPTHPAIICGGGVWNYGQLDDWSSKTASMLQSQHGVGPNTRVGVYLERRLELVGCLLAVMKAGATYVPLDPLYPRDRIAMMVEDGEITTLITSQGLMEAAAQVVTDANVKCSVIAIDEAETVAAIESQKPQAVWETDAESLAYIIFTSGSTGRPKGVPIKHRSLVNFLNSFVKCTDLSNKDVLLAVTTVCFDIAGLELYLPLLSGATTVLTTAEEQSDPTALQELMETHKVTILQATPVTWRLLLGNGWAGSDQLTALCGGEPLPPDLAMALRPAVRRLLNVYGPTETTIWSTLEQIELGVDGKIRAPVSIGGPIDNTTVYVVDQNLQLCPPGVRGELVIGGSGVSPGYWRRDDLSDGRFVPSPFVDGDVLYRTGDLVRWILRDDSATPILECLGRLDNQVKIRGFRIELAEIETALSTHSLVEQVVVDAMAFGGEGSPKELVAYVKSPRASAAGQDPLAADSAADSAQDLDEAAAWGAIYDEAYATKRAATDDPTLNWSGYDNSYTPGILHKEATVKEWVERICERIQTLPYTRVLELGAGNGMILFRIIKERALAKYIGTDLSTEACKFVDEVLELNPEYNNFPQVSTALAGAHEAQRIEAESQLAADLIICNGVSMYFPSAAYLLSAINNSLDAVADGGVFFLGDVRCLNLHQHFIASVELFKANDHEPCEDFDGRVAKQIKHEKELLCDPEFFTAVMKAGLLPDCARFEMNMREGIHHTEFAMYRYDVIFWKKKKEAGTAGRVLDRMGGSSGASKAAEYKIDPYDGAGVHSNFEQSIEERLVKGAEDYIAVSGVPDARLKPEDILVRTLRAKGTTPLPATTGDLSVLIEKAAPTTLAVEPDACYRLAEKHGYKATLMWTPGVEQVTFDVLFEKAGARICVGIAEAMRKSQPPTRVPVYSADMDIELFTNKADATDDVEDAGALSAADISQLRGQLRKSLPEYMIPSVFVAVDEFPQTNNGKIDRKSLPKPGKADIEKSVRSSPFVMPAEGIETEVASIWSDAFGLADISADDDFYQLGGHSLIAMKVINEVKKLFGAKLSMAQLGKSATPRLMAAFIDTTKGEASAADSAGLPVHTDANLQPVSGLPHSFEVLRHVWIPMKDGVRLAARVWLPQGLPKVSNIIEILPYRKSGGTTEIDEATYPYFAGHGFACIRVDSRGTGDSEGDFDDEYSELQQQDGVDVVEWAAGQAWSNGDCGLMGCSWGGFIAMQVAAKKPAGLKAIIAVCATDQRLEDDMHFEGGALLSENHSWAAWLLHTLSQPPDPIAVGESWRETWAQRLASIQPLANKWMQRSGSETSEKYWKTGSINHVTEPLAIPSFLVGGWSAGGYANSVFRVAEELQSAGVEHKAVVGPWAHSYPHLSPIGPQYNFLKDAVEWWKKHLGAPAAAAPASSPRLQLYSVCPQGQPDAQPSSVPGTWLDFDGLLKSTSAKTTLGLSAAGAIVSCADAKAMGEQAVELPDGRSNGAGLRSGRWFTFGTSPDRPIDQADDDKRSSCFDYPASDTGMVIFGRPAVKLTLAKNAAGVDCGTLCARLCAVAPSGISSRITYGLVNVDRHGETVQRAGQTFCSVTVTMNHTAFTLPEGYRLRLAISHGYWPIVACPATTSPPKIVVGGALGAILSIDTVTAATALGAVVTNGLDSEVAVPVPTAVTNLRRGRDAEWTVREDSNGAEVTTVDDRGCRRLDAESGLEIDSTVVETHSRKKSGGSSHTVEWRTTHARAPQQGAASGWHFDVRLTSEQTMLPDGAVTLSTRMEASAAPDEGWQIVDGEGGSTSVLQTVATREWTDHVAKRC